MAITRGDLLQATTAGGSTVTMRALGEPFQGQHVELVWVATEGEWDRAEHDGDEPDGIPWPTDAVTELASA